MSQDLRAALEKWATDGGAREMKGRSEMLALLWPVISAAERAEKFGFAVTEKDGELRNTYVDLRDALAELRKRLETP